MFVDVDRWGNYSIQDLTEWDLELLRAALRAYVQCNFGHVSKADRLRILIFDKEFRNIMKDENEL
ncbi:ornithine aminotransferase [Prevotella jejuni]|jgi:hypothetical protein|uniref:ornithine aminotransferase n=1 Tax=Prevotella jejuni TaxID=1177574 RepID=UPI001C5DA7CC|nr:ornithine aminotransferase [Prevotella jejuni]MBW4772035.1 ornithine aminotransferase [Prevotella jejuni]DAI50301.1 MAG TPA: hypothetical protein [Caudoviricetes sp.]